MAGRTFPSRPTGRRPQTQARGPQGRRPQGRRPQTRNTAPRRPGPVGRLPGRRGKTPQKSGVAGLLSSALSSLPIGGSGGKGRSRSLPGGAKGKPALALLAAGAGALLGKKQLDKRGGQSQPEYAAETPSPTPASAPTPAEPAAGL